jgi:hypothetical protein
METTVYARLRDGFVGIKKSSHWDTWVAAGLFMRCILVFTGILTPGNSTLIMLELLSLSDWEETGVGA